MDQIVYWGVNCPDWQLRAAFLSGCLIVALAGWLYVRKNVR